MNRDPGAAEHGQGRSPHPVLDRYYPDESARQEVVTGLFDSAAHHYDWINACMSLGSGRRYRRIALRSAGLRPGMKLLDVGCGTGVLGIEAQAMVTPSGLVVGLDPSAGMLACAREAGLQRGTRGRGERLPYASGTFDLLTMGYALRHVADLEIAFEEFRRVLKPGGSLLLLEITKPRSRLATLALKAYLGHFVPNLARLRRGGSETKLLMKYYWETIEHCVAPEVILESLRAAGFQVPEKSLNRRILSKYVAAKPSSSCSS